MVLWGGERLAALGSFRRHHATVLTQLTPNSNLLLLRIATGPGFDTVAVARGRGGGARGTLSRLEYGLDQITVAIRLRLRSESGRDAVGLLPFIFTRHLVYLFRK